MRKPSGPFAWVALLTGLLFLLLTAPYGRAHESPPGCTGSGLGIDLFANIGDVHIGDTIRYSVRIFNSPFPACDATGIQASVTTPDGVSNSITGLLIRRSLVPGQSDFYTNVVTYVVRAQDIRSDGTVRATAQDNGDIHQNDTDSRGGGNQGVNTEVNLPCISITAVCLGGVGENGAITFTGTVTNCGNNTLVGVTVTNFVNNGLTTVLFPTNLAIGQVASFSGSWVPSDACNPSTATLVARAVDQFTATPQTVTSSAGVTCSVVTTPGIKVTKVCPTVPVGPGQSLVFSGTVSNTGNVTLTNIVVVNDQPVPNTTVFTRGSLAPGQVVSFTGSYTVPENCSTTSTLAANALSRCGVPVTSSATSTCPITTAPAIVATLICPAAPVVAGGIVTYSGTVRNSGNITLNSVTVANTSQAVPSTSGLVGYWGFNETSGNVATDSSGNGNNGNIVNATRETGQFGNRLSFNGTSAYVNITNRPSINFAGAITMAAWIRPQAVDGIRMILGHGFTATPAAQVFLRIHDGQYEAGAGNGSGAPGLLVPVPPGDIGAWVHLAATYNGSAWTLYRNGLAVGSQTGLIPLLQVNTNWAIGARGGGGASFFNGAIDEVRMYNRALSESEINTLSSPPLLFSAATLAPGASGNFTLSAAAGTCSVTGNVIATGRDNCSGGTVTNIASATCPVPTAPAIRVTLTCPVTPVASGALITYTGTVMNSGDITLNNVTVSNNQSSPPIVFTVATLAPGATANFNTTFTAPTNTCSVSSTVTARGSDACSAALVGNTASATCPVVTTPGLTLAHYCPAVPVGPGESLTYTGSVSNSGNVTLTNVVVTSDKPELNTVIFTRTTLLPGAAATFTNSYPAPVACSVTKTLSARATSICGQTTNATSTITCPIVTTPGISVTATCTSGTLPPGGTATYSGTVRNTGNIALTNVRVVSDRPVANTTVFTVATLAPGISASFNGSYSVPADTCSVTANVSATGNDSCTGTPVTRTASATCPVTTAPAVTVVAGAPITYSGTVRNSGNITLTNVTVTDAQASPTTVFSVASLAPGVSANFNATFSTTAGACTVSSTATARGSDACTGNTVTHSASATCTLLTSARLVVIHNCPVNPAVAGGTLTYSGTVSNAGTVTLTNVFVVNDRSTNSPVFATATLIPGASSNFTASYTVPVNTACSITSTLTASGDDSCSGTRIFATNTSTCPLLTSPAIEVTQICPASPGLQGSVLTYTGTVRNNGNVTLSNIIVVSSRPAANTVIYTSATLAPGASASFSGSYTVPLNCCLVSSSLKATGRDVCSGALVSDTQTATCPVLTLPRLIVTKICSAEAWKTVGPGDVLQYSGMVSNAGNITLTEVTVVNDRPSANSMLLGPILLAPGEFANYTGSYIIPVDFCGTDTVTARGLDSCTDAPVTASTTTTCPVQTTPRIAVTKNCPAQATPYGGVFTFTGSVSNSGNVTLTNVFVTDSMPAPNTPVIGPITLAPGAARAFTGSFTAPLDCCEIMDTVTARGQDRCSGTRVAATATALCPLLTTPSFVIAQNCPTAPVAPGSVLTFTGSVSNSGNVGLTNVYVYNSEVSNNVPVTGPLELAPGQTEAFTGSYVVKAKGTFGTIGLTGIITDRFGVPSNYEGLTFADPDKGYGATQFYSVHKDDAGPNYTFDTMAAPGTITHRFTIVLPGIDSITFAAPDVGYGPVNFYYVRHENGVSKFGVIKPGGVVGTATDLFVAGPNFDAITFAAPDVGFGANLFYYLRHDSSGRSFFGTINPALPGTITDRFSGASIGSGFNALTFVSTDVGNGANRFYYLRSDGTANAPSTMGYIAPTATSGVVADRFNLGRPFTELTFTTTDVGYGANLFYYLGTSGYDPARADATGSSVTAIGADTCQGRSVTAVANCSGPIRPAGLMAATVTTLNRVATISWAATPGKTYRLQCKASLMDPIWLDIPGDVLATAATASKPDPMGASRQRFYRVMVVE